MPSLAQLHDQLRNAKHIVHIAHTGKHPVSGKEDTMMFEMYKKKPELGRQAEANVSALEKAIEEKAKKPRRTRKTKKAGRRTRRR